MLTLKCKFLLEEAKNMWIAIEMIDKEIPLFFLKKGKKKILFKGDNGWINNALGRLIAKNKDHTYKILEYYNIPYPKTLTIKNIKKINENLIDKDIWYPLVVKPSDSFCWNGISIVFKKKQLKKAIKEAWWFSKTIIIQKFIPGYDHRIMVVWDAVVAWLKRTPASILGDGKHTINNIIQKKNSSKQRWRNCDTSILTKIRTDRATTEYIKNKYWYTLQTVPKKNETIYLRGNSNLSTWWDAEDITDSIHPKFKKICCKIAKICICTVVGVDIIAPDITEDPEKQKWAVIEINSNSQHNIHQTDIFWKPRNVSRAILDLYFKK